MLLLTFASCGVKGPPVQYPETIVDSYVREYTGSDLSPEELERIKNQRAIPSTLDQQQQKLPTSNKP
jgi:predicted small lipoprotein YifL